MLGHFVSLALIGDEAAAPVVDGEGVGLAAGIDFDAAVGDGLESEAVAVDLLY